jgi:hypothetical protein
MSHNKIQVNSVNPDGSGNISITTDNVPETATNEYYTPARIDTKIAATNIDAFADVNTAGAADGNALVLSSGTWAPATVAATADVSMIGNGSTQAYPWTGAVGTANEAYSAGKQIEFYSLNLGIGLGSIKYDVRNAGTSDGTSAWTLTDSASYVSAGWVRAISYLPAGTYVVTAGVGIILPASGSYLDFRIYVNGSVFGSLSRIGGDTGFPRETTCLVNFASAPVAATDNQIDIRAVGSSADLTGQANAQSERGFLQIMRVA